jgi:hypothetical protein
MVKEFLYITLRRFSFSMFAAQTYKSFGINAEIKKQNTRLRSHIQEPVTCFVHRP